MTVVVQPLTYADLLEMPDDGNRYELIDGEIYMSPAPTRIHQILTRRVFELLLAFLRERGLDRELYFAPIEVRLPDGSAVQPDLVWVHPDRSDLLADNRWIDGPPDLAVEILSPSTRTRDLRLKRRVYEQAGVREYWLVDPVARSVTILFQGDAGYEAVVPSEGTVASVVLPGLLIDIPALFAGLPE